MQKGFKIIFEHKILHFFENSWRNFADIVSKPPPLQKQPCSIRTSKNFIVFFSTSSCARAGVRYQHSMQIIL